MPLLRMLAPDLSTGQRRRVALVRGLIAGPRVMLLDQPTMGLDCTAARSARGMIRHWVADDATRTVVLATNDLREADALCDRVAILDAGRVVACDAPAALVEKWPRQPIDAGERAAFGDLEAAFMQIVGRGAWAALP
jgi:ABC-type multidrug transport system ATPase subunit